MPSQPSPGGRWRGPAGSWAARKGSPLVVGYGDGEMYLGSDALAVGPFTNRIAYLDEGERLRGDIDHDKAQIFDRIPARP